MNASPASRLSLAACALAALFAQGAAAQPVPAEVRLVVASVEYSVGTERFYDLDGVDAWLAGRRERVVALDVCRDAPTPRLLAAVARYRPNGSLDIRSLAPAETLCASAGEGYRAGWSTRDAAAYWAADAQGHSIIP